MRFGGSAPQADWLLVGLGNPGPQYERTPHNVGFDVANELAKRWDLPRAKKRYAGLITDGRAGVPGLGVTPPRVAVLLPQTYMNEAGRSVGPARGALKVPLERVLVIHDEIDLAFGDIRPRMGGGLAGHNGLKSLRRELGSADFPRVRVGVGRPTVDGAPTFDPERVAAYVLGRYQQRPDEVRAVVEQAADVAERIVRGELEL